MNFGKVLREIRTFEGFTQKDIANYMSINPKTYGLYENQFKIIPLKHLNTFCNKFSLSIDYVFSFTSNSNYEKLKSEINWLLFTERIRKFRKENKLTQAKLAKSLNIDRSSISKYELQENSITTSFLYDLCKKYNISADYLLGKIDFIPDWCNKKDE